MKTLVTLFLAALCAFSSAGVMRAKPRPPAVSQTRDTWRSVRTNNLFVIGNAEPDKLRQVAAWLEFFHSAFARLVSRNVLNSSVPTTVILFKDDASFVPFKPLYQGRPANLAGFFQPGNDVNYIAISLDPGERDPYSTAFHEYVHLHVRDNIPDAPLWLNEGLAELYGSIQFSGSEALLGTPLPYYLRLLQNRELLPLPALLSIGTNSPHYNEADKTGIFYGQSWALVHYLMLGDRDRQDKFKRFLSLVGRGEPAAKAIQSTFGMSLAELEEELRGYIRRGDFAPQRISGVDDAQTYSSYTAMQRTALSDAEANYYLGDLLLHLSRANDAERYFKQAIALDPGFTAAQASLGSLYVQQRRYGEAKKYLEKATASRQSYLIHYYYAYVLSREGISPTGRITEYSRENAAAMREQLLRSIKLAPDYAPSRYLLAFVDLVTNEQVEEAVEMAQRAHQLAPSNSNYSLLLAQIHVLRSDHSSARVILEPLTRDSDQSVRAEAQDLLESLSYTTAGSNRNKSTPAISRSMIAEPLQSGTSPMLGGSSAGVAIRDGQTVQNSGSLPSVDEVLRRYIEALGGAAAINTVTSRVVKGTLDVVGTSRGGSFETYGQAPNKSLNVLQALPFGTIKLGCNGRSGWVATATGLRVLKNLELVTVQRDADLYAPLRLKNNYAKVTLAGMSKIGYRDVYVVDLQPAGGAAERLYLDAQTYLPARLNTVRTTGALSEPVEMYLDNWRAVDGVKYPFFISQRFSRLTLSFTVKEIQHNVTLDSNMFDPPTR
jgi:tetratricopeptide (TPR) repeat protein